MAQHLQFLADAESDGYTGQPVDLPYPDESFTHWWNRQTVGQQHRVHLISKSLGHTSPRGTWPYIGAVAR